MKHLYITKEAKYNFKGWTRHGLVFLLNDSTLSQDIKAQIRHKLNLLHTVES